jgi:hypothetical protein
MFGKEKELFSIDMSQIPKGYEGKWVAFSSSEGQSVIEGSGATIREAVEKAQKKGINDPVLVRVPEEACSYVI